MTELSRQCPRKDCNYPLDELDIPAARVHNEPGLFQCGECGNIYKDFDGELTNITSWFEQLAVGDDRVRAALSSGHEVKDESVMEMIIKWRASSEMSTLSMIGKIQQRLGMLDNRLHSLKRRLAGALLGEPTPLETKEMLGLVDECIDLASPSPARERGVKPS
jgi:hypothetical protein